MTRNEMLNAFEAFLSLPVTPLIAYADEDQIGGFDFDPVVSKFPSGSLWACEGEALYALVRALKPALVLELGTHRGCSTSHLAAAVNRNGTLANGKVGSVIAVDIWEGAGDLILPSVRDCVQQVFMEALDAIDQLEDGSVNFAFIDLLHGRKEVHNVLVGLRPKMAKRGIVVHHDSEHGDDGTQVKAGVTDAGVTEYLSLLSAPSDCGLLVHRWGE